MDNFALRNVRVLSITEARKNYLSIQLCVLCPETENKNGDFLLLYNKISESCFIHCVNQLGERDLTQDENRCVDVCTRKFVNVNHKVMQVYMEVQPQIVNRRIEEMNKQAAKVEMNNAANNQVTDSKEVKVNAAGT